MCGILFSSKEIKEIKKTIKLIELGKFLQK